MGRAGTIYTVALIVFTAVAAYAGTVTGKVTSVSPATGQITITTDDGKTQTFGIGNARVSKDGQGASMSDIRSGSSVRVTYAFGPGGAVGPMFVPASCVEIIGSNPWVQPSLGYNSVGTIVTLRGTVSSVQADISTIGLTTPYGLITVRIPAYTDMRSFGRGISLMSVRTGTYAVVTGRLESLTVIAAYTINIGGPDSTTDSPATLLSGTVIRETDIASRSMTLRTPLGEKLVQAAPGARVTRRGYQITAYDLRYGDLVQAMGRWSGGVYIALQIDVVKDGASYRWIKTGRIVTIDPIRNEFVFDIGAEDVLIGASNAEIWLGSERKSFSDLGVGTRATVYGEQLRNRIDSTRIEILLGLRS